MVIPKKRGGLVIEAEPISVGEKLLFYRKNQKRNDV